MDALTLVLMIVPLLIAYVAYNERDKLKMRLKSVISKEEAEKLIDLKLIENKIEIKEIKNDIHEVKKKLDRVIEILISR